MFFFLLCFVGIFVNVSSLTFISTSHVQDLAPFLSWPSKLTKHKCKREKSSSYGCFLAFHLSLRHTVHALVISLQNIAQWFSWAVNVVQWNRFSFYVFIYSDRTVGSLNPTILHIKVSETKKLNSLSLSIVLFSSLVESRNELELSFSGNRSQASSISPPQALFNTFLGNVPASCVRGRGGWGISSTKLGLLFCSDNQKWIRAGDSPLRYKFFFFFFTFT